MARLVRSVSAAGTNDCLAHGDADATRPPMTTAAAPQQPAGSKEAAGQQPVGSKEAAVLQQGGGSTAASRRLNKKQHCSKEALTAGCPGIPTGQSGQPSWPAAEPHQWRRPRQHCERAQHEGLVIKGWARWGRQAWVHGRQAAHSGGGHGAALHCMCVRWCGAMQECGPAGPSAGQGRPVTLSGAPPLDRPPRSTRQAHAELATGWLHREQQQRR